MNHRDIVAANLESVLSRIDRACQKSGRAASEVQLVAVTKYAQLDWVRDLISLGQTRLGENRPQQLASRAVELGDVAEISFDETSPGIEWHQIGHLQRNKVELVLPVAALTHSIDSVRLLRRVSEIAAKQQKAARVLLEVNVSGEASKDGFTPSTLIDEWSELTGFANVLIEGLMTMAPQCDHPDEARPYFARLRELRDTLRSANPGGPQLPELSMGMSGDFEAAIAEGATVVRVGSLLFDGLES